MGFAEDLSIVQVLGRDSRLLGKVSLKGVSGLDTFGVFSWTGNRGSNPLPCAYVTPDWDCVWLARVRVGPGRSMTDSRSCS